MNHNALAHIALPHTALPHTAIKPYLDSLNVVMVNTTLPANIGSAARAMWTMGLSHLIVVNPKLPIDASSIAHAAGAQTVLANCQVVDRLEDALSDCQLVFAASSRQRHIPRPVVTPSQAAQLILQHQSSLLKTEQQQDSFQDRLQDSATLANPPPLTVQTSVANYPKVAILFGREDRGLTNEELALADYHIQIDANPAYPVLNVASAVQVIASFFYSECLNHAQRLASRDADNRLMTQQPTPEPMLQLMLRQVWDAPAITQQQKLDLQTRMIDLMHQLTLTDSTDPEQLRELPNRLSRLLSRLQLDQKEFALLSAMIAKISLKV